MLNWIADSREAVLKLQVMDFLSCECREKRPFCGLYPEVNCPVI